MVEENRGRGEGEGNFQRIEHKNKMRMKRRKGPFNIAPKPDKKRTISTRTKKRSRI